MLLPETGVAALRFGLVAVPKNTKIYVFTRVC